MGLQVGDSFFGALPGQTKHLWFVLTKPNDDGKVVIANLSSSRLCSDENCVVQPGEHPFAKKKSIIRYGDARLVSIILVNAYVEKAHRPTREPLTSALYARIVEGGLRSDDTAGNIRTELDRRSLSALEYEGLRKSL